jgi:hypothetical protein
MVKTRKILINRLRSIMQLDNDLKTIIRLKYKPWFLIESLENVKNNLTIVKTRKIITDSWHLQSLAPTNPHWARVVGYGPFSLWVIHKEGPRPCSGDILISWWWITDSPRSTMQTRRCAKDRLKYGHFDCKNIKLNFLCIWQYQMIIRHK